MEEEEEEAALQLALTSPCVEQPAIDLLLCSLFRRCQQLGIPVPSSALPPPVSQEPPRSILSARDLSRISSLSVRATTSAEGDVGFGKGATRPTEPGVTTTTTLLARCRPAAAAVTATAAHCNHRRCNHFCTSCRCPTTHHAINSLDPPTPTITNLHRASKPIPLLHVSAVHPPLLRPRFLDPAVIAQPKCLQKLAASA